MKADAGKFITVMAALSAFMVGVNVPLATRLTTTSASSKGVSC